MFANPGQALSGAVSGLRVVNTSGSPNATPSIALRGGTNWDGTGTPLVIVDGMLRESGFQDINPEDIASMDVLKDAGATAIYGARASNGVIFITTKKGASGQSQINFKGRVGLNYYYSPIEFLDTEDYITYMRKAYNETPWADRGMLKAAQPFGTGNVYGEDGSKMLWNLMAYDPKYDFLLSKGWKTMDDPVGGGKLMYRDTDFKSYNMNDPALTQDYNVNMSGGNDKGHYYASFGYNKIEGMPINMYNERYNVLFNGDYMIAPWLKSISSFSYNRGNWTPMPYGQQGEANYFGRIMSMPPTARFEDEEGNMLLGANAGDGNQYIYDGNNAFRISNLANYGLRWERTRTAEIGLDLGFLQNRINFNMTYYNRLTMDKYAAFTLPSTTGFSSIQNNNGKYRNAGLEFELAAKVMRKKDFSWDVKANIAYNRNKVVSLPDNGLPKNRQGGTEVYTGRKDADGNWETIYIGGYQEGQEPGYFTAFQFEGLYQSDDEVPYDFVDMRGNLAGKVLYSKARYDSMSAAEKARAWYVGAGDAKWKDVNGDGIIDARDQVKVGNTTPRWFGGFNTTLNWKGLQFYARFDYAFDFWTMDISSPWFDGCGQGTYNASTNVLDAWSTENPNGKYPKYVFADQLGANNYFRPSTLYAYRGDYLAFREISLSYSLPEKWLNKTLLSKVTFSVSGQNLGYLTASPTNTPEVGRSYALSSGDGYGLPRTILFGLDLTF